MKTFAITLTAILLAAFAAPAPGATIGQWNLDEGPVGAVPTGTGAILDSVGGHNGTPLGSLTYRAAATGDGGTLGLEFPNNLDRVFIPDSPELRSPTALPSRRTSSRRRRRATSRDLLPRR